MFLISSQLITFLVFFFLTWAVKKRKGRYRLFAIHFQYTPMGNVVFDEIGNKVMKQKRLIWKVNHVKHTVFFDPLSETAFCTGMCSYSEYAFFARPWNEVILNSIEVKYVLLFPFRGRCDIEPISVAILSKMFASYSRWLKMHPVKRLHARNTKTAFEYTHFQV